MNTTAVRALPRISNGVPAWMQTKEVTSPTTNYAVFKIDERNRPISVAHVEKLRAAVESKNLLREYPIVVDKNMVVIDGQHRLTVATILNLPVYFVISDLASIEDVSSTTKLVSKWTGSDYLQYWCKAGKPEYLKLREFMAKYPFIPFATASRITTFGNQRYVGDEFALGQYQAGNLERAETVAKAAMDFEPYFRYWSQTAFITSIRSCILDPKYDHARMMQKMVHVSTRLVKCSTVEHYLAILSDIYNWKVQQAQIHILKPIKAK